ncbi:MAG: type II toxin-antitoxin system PemK/MazF family toxin, partial [Syntrophomonadaceae bacterium]
MIKRGEIYFAQLNPVVGSEQGGIRPVLVVQNDIGNQYSPTTIVLAITSQINKAKLP